VVNYGEDNFRTKDDRGRPVKMLDPYMLHLLRRHDTIDADSLAMLARDLGSGRNKAARIAFVIGLILALIGVVAIAVHVLAKVLSGHSFLPLPTALMFANIWLMVMIVCWSSARMIRSRRIRSVMLAHCRCPHCGYDLRLLPTDPTDGATVCPECGCAWGLEPRAPGE
jgi:hypothetical protein